MRMCNRSVLAALATLISLMPCAAVADEALPFASATEAYRKGMAALKSGNPELALPALDYAAERGVLGAQLKLARFYSAGNGVRTDDAKSFFFYRQIANQRADISPLSPVAKYVAEAFVALGQFYLQGIPSAPLPKDPARAADLFRHAASYFGSADAQYALAQLYLDGDGVEKNVDLAVNWLATAAKKRHPAAQATLGELLWRGSDEVRQRRARGLALIMLAHANAKAAGKEPKWIEELYLEVQRAANPTLLGKARTIVTELGGPTEVMSPVTTNAVAPDKLVVPASGAATAKAIAAPSPTADAVVSSETAAGAPPAAQMGVSAGFGEMSSDPVGIKP